VDAWTPERLPVPPINERTKMATPQEPQARATEYAFPGVAALGGPHAEIAAARMRDAYLELQAAGADVAVERLLEIDRVASRRDFATLEVLAVSDPLLEDLSEVHHAVFGESWAGVTASLSYRCCSHGFFSAGPACSIRDSWRATRDWPRAPFLCFGSKGLVGDSFQPSLARRSLHSPS